MRGLVVAVLVLMVGAVLGDPGAAGNVKDPQVYFYTRHPLKNGEDNQLICHCTGFHPPIIEMVLKRNGEEIDQCQQSDMTFKEDWAYYTTKHAPFKPEDGAKYTCDVKHNNGQVKTYALDNPMM